MKENEPTYCKSCSKWFFESISEHGSDEHPNERWDVDYQRERGEQ